MLPDRVALFSIKFITGGQFPDVRGLRRHLLHTVTFLVVFENKLSWEFQIINASSISLTTVLFDMPIYFSVYCCDVNDLQIELEKINIIHSISKAAPVLLLQTFPSILHETTLRSFVQVFL